MEEPTDSELPKDSDAADLIVKMNKMIQIAADHEYPGV